METTTDYGKVEPPKKKNTPPYPAALTPEQLRIAQKASGLSQTALAKRMGIKTQPTVSNWFTGTRNITKAHAKLLICVCEAARTGRTLPEDIGDWEPLPESERRVDEPEPEPVRRDDGYDWPGLVRRMMARLDDAIQFGVNAERYGGRRMEALGDCTKVRDEAKDALAMAQTPAVRAGT